MTGGGFGGSAIALVAADEVDRVAQAVADAFADAGPAGAGVPGGDGGGPRRLTGRRRPAPAPQPGPVGSRDRDACLRDAIACPVA